MSTEVAVTGEVSPVPKYEDIVPTEEQLQAQREKHPGDSDKKILWRAKMSILAKARHEHDRDENGRPRFGGAQKGAGRPPKRLGKAFLDWADDNQKAVLDALGASLKEGDAQQRGKKALDIIKSVREENKIEIKERAYENANKDDLVTAFVKSFAQKIRDKDPAVKELAQKLLELDSASSEIIEGEIVS